VWVHMRKERFSALKRKGLFNVFPNLERKVIKSATKEEICFFITNQRHQRGQQHKFSKSDFF
jgi:hypothetical protein